ncbi:hypothetical protein C8Q77DRAFT_1227493 [Trametes polyzona]|nr:hypothetical protein C8Q77DRAFT_1227493 [Trametes polyzona]
MPLFLRALTATGQQSLTFFDQAASRLFSTLQNVVHRAASAASSHDEQVVDSTSSSQVEEETTTEHEEDSIELEETSGDSSESSDSDDTGDEERITESTAESSAEELRSASGGQDDATESAVASFAPGATNLQAYLENSPVRHHRDFVRGSRSSPEPADAIAGPSSAPSSSTDGSLTPPQRERKRSRDDFDDEEDNSSNRDSESSDAPDTSSAPPSRQRRRLSLPHPECSRESCHSRNHEHLDEVPEEAPEADEEDTWSTVAQPSDTEADPNDEVFRVRRHAPRRMPKRSRDEADGENGGEHPYKRRRSAKED